MNRKTLLTIGITALLTLAISMGVALAAFLSAPPPVADASAVDGYAQYSWYNNSVTTTTTGAGRFTADYGRFECYSIVDVALTQTLTLTLQSSPDNTNWADQPIWQFATNVLAVAASPTAQTADGVGFFISILEGQYTRPVFTLGESNPVTATLKCIAKDRPGYDLEQEAGAIESTD